jgi:hypothetical protein
MGGAVAKAALPISVKGRRGPQLRAETASFHKQTAHPITREMHQIPAYPAVTRTSWAESHGPSHGRSGSAGTGPRGRTGLVAGIRSASMLLSQLSRTGRGPPQHPRSRPEDPVHQALPAQTRRAGGRLGCRGRCPARGPSEATLVNAPRRGPSPATDSRAPAAPSALPTRGPAGPGPGPG